MSGAGAVLYIGDQPLLVDQQRLIVDDGLATVCGEHVHRIG